MKHDTTGDSNLKAPNVLRLELRGNGTRILKHFYFTRDEGHLVLWNIFGDPDDLAFIEYVREPK